MDSMMILVGVALVSSAITFLVAKYRFEGGLKKEGSLSQRIKTATVELDSLLENVQNSKSEFDKIDAETKSLQELKSNNAALEAAYKKNQIELDALLKTISHKNAAESELSTNIAALMSKLDLYKRLEEFVEFGHFEMPEYLHETSERFAEEIKRARDLQKDLIQRRQAVSYPEGTVVHPDKSYNNKILEGQIKLMLSAFNIECDMLMEGVTPSNLSRTLERIENLAEALEKSAASFRCGFNIEYVKLKFKETELQYQFRLKKQEEMEEQKLIREQIREEQKAAQEYERAIAEAEKEERQYQELLNKARKELALSSDKEKEAAEARIAMLEQQLAEARAKEERAKSMAEMTRKGHVYIISNVGSFGENVYKIGLTRRLDPHDRVKELSDASVPFSFDIHALFYWDDAPALEAALHRKFAHARVNAVNHRKEFFSVDLLKIKEAVEEITKGQTEFKLTAIAEEYYETLRMRGKSKSAV
jgi:tetratricopeptide (TPR) repeat protein